MANNDPNKRPVGPQLNWKFISVCLILIVGLIIAIVGMQTDAFSRDQSAVETESSSAASSSDTVAQSSTAKTDSAVISAADLAINTKPLLAAPETVPEKFAFKSGIDIPYPEEGVKGIYLTAHGMTEYQQQTLDLLDNSALNAVVLDVKDDWGSLTMTLPSENPEIAEATVPSLDTETTMSIFEEKQIYPIARITTFKDQHRAEKHPELSFRRADGSLWRSYSGDAFLNPYMKENWSYMVDVAKAAAQVGFKDIQFDYVRFPEGFENVGVDLVYEMGDYAEYGKDSVEARQQVIADFLEFASQELEPFNVDISADIFGYVTMVESTPGIGQNFVKIAEHVDVVSAMIYPSHWGPGYFGYDAPDLEPYGVVNQYIQAESALLKTTANPPKTRPWIQDFTADYLGAGNYMTYDAAAVQAQIDALAKNGVHEYLLWDAANTYTPGVTY